MKTYASKLLLFGEYTIINGSRALAIPYPAYSAYWEQGDSPDARLQHFATYLEEQDQLRSILDLDAFRSDVEQGLFFHSDIPVGYGLGSSGALCAAVYDRYARQPVARTAVTEFDALRRLLARMESHFHGSSSGTDPLICYVEAPVLLRAGGGIDIVELPDLSAQPYLFFLLNTGIARSTGPLVTHYLTQCRTESYAGLIQTQLVPQVDGVIDDFLSGDWEPVRRRVGEISRLQWDHFQRMIPDELKPLWLRGLQDGYYSLKLCGAGGGGFLLGIADSKAGLETLGKAFPCTALW